MREHRPNRKNMLHIICVVMLLAGLIAACGAAPTAVPTSGAPAATPTTAAAVAATATVAAPQPTAGQERTLVIALPGNIETIDPQLRSGEAYLLEVIHNVNAQLVDRKIEDKQGVLWESGDQIQPGLAESWEYNADHSVWTFHIRPGLKFANGDPITKEDWEWNFDRMFAEKAVTQVLLCRATVCDRSQIEVVDDTTIRIHVKTPNTIIEPFFGTSSSGVINSRLAKEHVTADDPWADKWLRTNNVGAGPFTLESWATDQLVLVKNGNYYGAPQEPWFDKIIYKIVPDPSTRVALLRSGDVDVAYSLPLESIPDLEQDPNLTVFNMPTTMITMLIMNVHTPPFDNVKVRQAINYAVPYDTIMQQVVGNMGQRSYNYVPVGMPGYDTTVPHYDTDIAKAKQLLAEAGYPDGFSTELVVKAESAEGEKVGVWVQTGLQEVSIDVKVVKMPSAAYDEQSRLRKIPFYVNEGWITTTNDPLVHLSWLVKSECCNYADYDNQTVWDLIDKYMLSIDTEARNAAIHQAQEILYNDAPWVPLYQPNGILVFRKDIQGVVISPFRQEQIWWLAARAGQ
jgi:peptide/nickel transport system substrate-binding protein